MIRIGLDITLQLYNQVTASMKNVMGPKWGSYVKSSIKPARVPGSPEATSTLSSSLDEYNNANLFSFFLINNTIKSLKSNYYSHMCGTIIYINVPEYKLILKMHYKPVILHIYDFSNKFIKIFANNTQSQIQLNITSIISEKVN